MGLSEIERKGRSIPCNWGRSIPCNWGRSIPCNWGRSISCNWGRSISCNWVVQFHARGSFKRMQFYTRSFISRNLALFRASHENSKKQAELKRVEDNFVLEGLDRSIASYEEEKKRYETEFKRLSKKHKEIRFLKNIPGIGVINSVKIVARVVDPHRFDRNFWWSYCDLVKLVKLSGGRSYGTKSSRYCPQMKCVFKTAALAVIGGNNEFNELYEHLMTEKNYPPHTARNAVSRRISSLTLGVLKSCPCENSESSYSQ